MTDLSIWNFIHSVPVFYLPAPTAQDESSLSIFSFSGMPVKQEKPSTFPDSRTLFPPRTYIPQIHIPVLIPHRTVPVTSRPFVRPPYAKPSNPRQPYAPLKPSRSYQQPHQPVVLTGVAGPPGYAQRVPTRQERGSQELGKSINGFAGAPGQRPHKLSVSAPCTMFNLKILTPLSCTSTSGHPPVNPVAYKPHPIAGKKLWSLYAH